MNPEDATRLIVEQQRDTIADLFQTFMQAGKTEAFQAYTNPRNARKQAQSARTILERQLTILTRWFNEAIREKLESDFGNYARKALQPLLGEEEQRQRTTTIIDDVLADIAEEVKNATDDNTKPKTKKATPDEKKDQPWKAQVDQIVREFAKLDGYDVWLKARGAFAIRNIKNPKYWSAQVREFAVDPEWSGTQDDGTLIEGSHDRNNQIRSEYYAYLRDKLKIYETKDSKKSTGDSKQQPIGLIKQAFLRLLIPSCIEANDLNLSAGRYKPTTIGTTQYDPPNQIIRSLQVLEANIQSGLGRLLEMVETEL
ncbi:MAG: hypothetical protein HC780_29610 [Leptolyngbyaceae cyanobacterium CSU_1_3]|nr:hypothetical protein [Leptolyngbyaceae cyanobacterium CSU_1_3]